jgi:type I restriction enzyme S subunit
MSSLVGRPIEDYCLGIYDGPHATPSEAEDGPVFLGIKNITESGSLELSEIRHVSEQEFPRWTRRVTPEAGDVVFTYEATLHRYAVIPEGFRGCLGRRVALVRPNPIKADSRYILYYFLSSRWRQVVESNIVTGATVDRIPLERFPNFQVLMPHLRIQQRIGDILSAYDELVENNRRRMALLEDAARQLYREWFVRLRFPGYEHKRVENGVPIGWERTHALSAMEVLSGGTPKTTNPDYWDGDFPFFTPKDASDTYYVLTTERSITELGLKNCNSRLYEPNTIFITARGTVGRLNLASRPMAMSQSCYALMGKRHVSQLFLFCALGESIEHFRQHAGGAVFDAIVVDTFKLIPFLIPNERLVRMFESTVAPMFQQISNLMEQNDKLRTARDLLLPRLISGEIAV